MKKTLAVLSLLFVAAVSYAADTAPVATDKPSTPVVAPPSAPAAAPVMTAEPAKVEPAKPMTADDTAKLVNGEATTQEVTASAEDLLSAYKEVKGAGTKQAKLFAIMAGLAVLFKFLLSLLKVMVKADFWKGAKAKWILRIITASLGVGVFLATNLGFGMPWFDALFLALSGPGAVVIHEYASKPKASDTAKAAQQG